MCQYPPPPPSDAFVPWFSNVFDAVLLLTAVVVGEQAARLTAQAKVKITAHIALVMQRPTPM
jgi:hypothetical protein